ncbi:1676_t:CDS:1, partial [Racocetra persica]
DLDQPEMETPIMSNPNNWVKKFAYLYNILKDEKFNKRTNNDSLELYYQVRELLAKREWSNSAMNELNLYFNDSRKKLISQIAKRVFLLFNTRDQSAIQAV